ncbi:MAG: pseudouridine synthase [Acidiferrobacteraceae bacterium]
MEKVRISKILSERGVCSRREADAFLEKGWVYVDGVQANLGERMTPGQQVTLDPRAEQALGRQITVLLNKPVGYVSNQPEKGYPAALSLIRPENQFLTARDDRAFEGRHLVGLAPAGRLDIDSQGLLILTQDGRLARRLVGSHTVEKEYLVRVTGTLAERDLRRLNHGMVLDGEPLRPAMVSWQNREQLRFVLTEGKKRQIRRMCEAVGLTVTGLKRIRIGRVRLGALPVGKWRYLGRDEDF